MLLVSIWIWRSRISRYIHAEWLQGILCSGSTHLMMSDSIANYSDDEVRTGDLTLDEIKTHISKLHRRETLYECVKTEENCNRSIKIIEIHSTPNIVSICNSNLSSATAIIKAESSPNLVPEDVKLLSIKKVQLEYQDSDESFLNMERMIAKLCGSPENCNDLKTLEEGAKYDLNIKSKTTDNKHKSNESISVEVKKDLFNSDEVTTQLHKLQFVTGNTSQFKTPYKDNIDTNSVYTQTGNRETPIFKTPGKYSPHKTKIVTPASNLYEHVVSPVAAYIRKCPTTVSLLQNIRPKKAIVGTSSIPKLVKSIPKSNVNNKENSALPLVAYRTAKETKLIEVPDQQRLPKSQWAKQVASSIPKAFVIKHSHPRASPTKQPFRIQQEDSFNDLPLQQADISVCTKKSAFNNLKNQ